MSTAPCISEWSLPFLASPSLPDLLLPTSKSRATLAVNHIFFVFISLILIFLDFQRRGSFSLERALQIAHQTLNEYAYF